MFDFLEKVVLNTVGPTVSLGLAALIGQRLSAKWAERQKKREHELALANTFYSSYGEFCAVWKDWNRTLREGESSPGAQKRPPRPFPASLSRRSSLAVAASRRGLTIRSSRV
jgi:hypothetical protein